MAKTLDDVLYSITELNVKLELRVRTLEHKLEMMDIQLNTLHQRSHTHSPMYGNFTGNAPIDCTKAGVK